MTIQDRMDGVDAGSSIIQCEGNEDEWGHEAVELKVVR